MKIAIGILFSLLIGLVFVACALAQINDDWIPDTESKESLLLSAIYYAEGGKNTNYPFGIKSVNCGGDYVRCKNTRV